MTTMSETGSQRRLGKKGMEDFKRMTGGQTGSWDGNQETQIQRPTLARRCSLRFPSQHKSPHYVMFFLA